MHPTTQHRITVVLSVKQYEELAKRAAALECSLAAVIRQVVNAGLKRKVA